MPSATDKLVDSFVAKLRSGDLSIQDANNKSRLNSLEAILPKRLPSSFSSFLSRFSFPAFEVLGICFFGWESDRNKYALEAAAPKGSLSEVLRPAGFVQIGQPDPVNFDAVCFDLNGQNQNREYPIVQIDHEEILCNWRIRVTCTLWPSFVHFASAVIVAKNLRVELNDLHDPIV